MTTAITQAAPPGPATTPPPFNYAAMECLIQALRRLTEATGNAELPMQTAVFFLYVAQRHPNEVPYGEIEQVLGMTQASTSRNAGYLSRGLPPRDGRPRPGYELLEVFEDPYYTKRKLCRLTERGVTLAVALSDVVSRR